MTCTECQNNTYEFRLPPIRHITAVRNMNRDRESIPFSFSASLVWFAYGGIAFGCAYYLYCRQFIDSLLMALSGGGSFGLLYGLLCWSIKLAVVLKTTQIVTKNNELPLVDTVTVNHGIGESIEVPKKRLGRIINGVKMSGAWLDEIERQYRTGKDNLVRGNFWTGSDYGTMAKALIQDELLIKRGRSYYFSENFGEWITDGN